MVEKMVSITIPIAVEIMIVLGITLSANIGTFRSAYAQANATTNQTGETTGPTPSEQASQSIRGAITDTGQFVHNATVKVAGSKSAQTLVNESSGVLGNATVAAKKYFGSK